MQNVELIKQYKKLVQLIDDTDTSTDGDLELQGHWGKYLCVLASGFLENAISAVYSDFVSQAASAHVIQYTQKNLDKIQNPKSDKFIAVASQFKKSWGTELKNHFDEHPENKQAIDSIITNRHLVAHGKTTSISVHRVRDYLEKSVKIIEFIEGQCANQI